MKLKNIVVLAFLVTSLVGCASLRTIFTSEAIVEENETLVCRVPYEFQAPSPVNMRDVHFHVLTPEIMKDIVTGNPNDLPDVYIAMTIEDYENMSYNMVEILNYIKSNKALFNEISLYYSNTPRPEGSE